MLLHRSQLDTTRLHTRVVVVLDVIFATSSIVAALSHGALDVAPCADESAARRLAGESPPGAVVCAGEKDARTFGGCAHFAPLRLCEADVAQRRIAYATTNGTPTLLAAAGAPHVYAAALLNRSALAAHLVGAHAGQDVVVLCSGSAGGFNLEDFHGAGAMVADLIANGHWRLTDSARAALAVFETYSPRQALHEARVGRLMHTLGLGDEVDYCTRLDSVAVVPRLRDGRLLDVRRDRG